MAESAKNKTHSVRVDEEDYEQYKEFAEEMGMTPSEETRAHIYLFNENKEYREWIKEAAEKDKSSNPVEHFFESESSIEEALSQVEHLVSRGEYQAAHEINGSLYDSYPATARITGRYIENSKE